MLRDIALLCVTSVCYCQRADSRPLQDDGTSSWWGRCGRPAVDVPLLLLLWEHRRR